MFEHLPLVFTINLSIENVSKRSRRISNKSVSNWIQLDRLAKLVCNYNLISKQLTESNMQFNIKN